jgi:hypothetical protein
MDLKQAETEILRLQQDVKKLRVAQQQTVTVTFLNTNQDQDVSHTLQVEDPENITYEIVRSDRPVVVYDNRDVPRRAWTKSYITLRANATATVILRLSVAR